MTNDLQKALSRDQKVQVTVWDVQDDSVELTFPSFIMEAGPNLLRIAGPSQQAEAILPLLVEGIIVGMLVEAYPNPFIFYPRVYSKPISVEGGFWLRVPENPQVEVVHRRKHVRIPMLVAVEVEYVEYKEDETEERKRLEARTEDLSGGGIRFTSIRQFEEGEIIAIILPLLQGQPVLRLKATVIFSGENRVKRQFDDLYATSCQFLDLDEAQESALIRECFRREVRLNQ